MGQDFDLFGNPVAPARDGPGRPEHVPTEENIINIMVLLASGMTNKEISKTIGLSVPTLRKHYLHLTRQRDVMLDRLRAKLRTAQIQQGLAGNAAALSAAIRSLDGIAAEKANRDLASRAANAPGKTPAGYQSKKEDRLSRARAISASGDKFAPPPGPRLAAANGQMVADIDEG